MDERIERIHIAADYVRGRLEGRQPKAAIILGSGLGPIGDMLEDKIVIPYKEIPGFPVSTAIGHKGNFICGKLGGKGSVLVKGAREGYEGYHMETVTIGVRVFKVLGIDFLFVSNPAGACNPDFKTGDLIIIRDHISLFPNPLIGPNMDEFGPRFPDMTAPYDLELQEQMVEISKEEGIPVRRGIYVSTSGPCYETPAEYKFFRKIGGDTVGMSVTPEVIAARHSGIRVLGMSVVTDVAHEATDGYVTDENEIVRQADAAAHKMERLFSRLIESI